MPKLPRATLALPLQERLWKRAAALAIGYEVAKLRGKFGLRPPPEGQRKYHDEIAALRAAAARDGGAADKAGSGRRGEEPGGRAAGWPGSVCRCTGGT